MPALEILAWVGEYSIYQPDIEELWSWVLYHWLWTYRRDALADYEWRLASDENPARAWMAAFQHLTRCSLRHEKLDEALDQHRRDDRISYCASR